MPEQEKLNWPPKPAGGTNHHPLAPPGGDAAGYQKAARYPNPPDATNPDPATLREQWRYATRQYGKWYGHAWGTAILAGVAFFALGWVIKGTNPLPSRSHHPEDQIPDQ